MQFPSVASLALPTEPIATVSSPPSRPTSPNTSPNSSPSEAWGGIIFLLIMLGVAIWGFVTQEATGHGSLQVSNGTPNDAAIKLVDRDSGRTLRFAYVQAGDTVTISGIGSHICILKYTTGKDWDSSTKRFRRNASFVQFDKPLDFREVPTFAGVQWMNYSATLHPVTYGNARTTAIWEKSF